MKKEVPVYIKSWDQKSPAERVRTEKTFEAISMMRRTGKSRTEASRAVGISPVTVLKYARPAFKRVNGRWKVKKFDRLPRPPMNIMEDGRLRSIIVNDSREASKIARYFSAVGIYLDKGDPKPLLNFMYVKVRDSDGRLHSFETNPKTVEEIIRKSEPETPEPYNI